MLVACEYLYAGRSYPTKKTRSFTSDKIGTDQMSIRISMLSSWHVENKMPPCSPTRPDSSQIQHSAKLCSWWCWNGTRYCTFEHRRVDRLLLAGGLPNLCTCARVGETARFHQLSYSHESLKSPWTYFYHNVLVSGTNASCWLCG